MEKISLILVLISVLFTVTSRGTSLSWNSLFQVGMGTNGSASTSNIRTYANQRLAALRNLRNQLYNSTVKVQFVRGNENPLNDTRSKVTIPKAKGKLSTSSDVKPYEMRREMASFSAGSIFRSLDKLLSFTGHIKKMITSKQGIESLAGMVLPKQDVLQKLFEIKGRLEPSVRRYLMDTYNGFLSSLIPYSENIGVAPFVLNSMKIPQDLDPRWQLIQTMIGEKNGVQKFIHEVVSGQAFAKIPQVVESRSGDETKLISDQEPDAIGQQYRRQQQMYLSSFKKRLMKPGGVGGGGRYRWASGLRPALDYENILDQNGQFSQVSYDMRPPDEMMTETYPNGGSEMDMMVMSASGHGGRGHGHGHGHASYGGFLDPFTILGGLAFLTYLGLMLQNSLNRNNTNIGRSLSWDSKDLVVPTKLDFRDLEATQLKRRGRSLVLDSFEDKGVLEGNMKDVLIQIENVWEDLQELSRVTANPHWKGSNECIRNKVCKIVSKLKYMDLVNVFAGKLLSSTPTTDHNFLKHLMEGEDLKMCEPYWAVWCKFTG